MRCALPSGPATIGPATGRDERRWQLERGARGGAQRATGLARYAGLPRSARRQQRRAHRALPGARAQWAATRSGVPHER